jgi:hypothetical protein
MLEVLPKLSLFLSTNSTSSSFAICSFRVILESAQGAQSAAPPDLCSPATIEFPFHRKRTTGEYWRFGSQN